MIRKHNSAFLILLFLSAVLPFVASGCHPGGDSALAGPADYVDPRLVEANSAFAFDLFHALRAETPGGNLFISPASVSLALAMTYNGAAGETAAAMAGVLRFQGMSPEEINTAFADLRTILQNPDPQVELALANSLWARRGAGFYEDFLQLNRNYYGAEVAELDFDRPEAAATINRWVEEQTNGRIKDLIEPPIDLQTVLFLINALYFNAAWTEPFDPEQTREIPFYLPDGSSKDHPVMFREGEFQALTGEGFQAVCLPYGKKGRIGMYLFLPEQGRSLENFYEQLTPSSWSSWLESFGETEGFVGLPRFKIEYESSLNDVLKELGMAIAFDETAADFSRMRSVPPRLFIKEVKHKTFVEVNEKGTEAAGATSVEIAEESAPAFNLVVNRPFFFSIVDNQTGSILFMGSVTNPEK